MGLEVKKVKMSAADTKWSGGCMYGAVRYEATGEPVGLVYCHCESCRRHSGAPVSALAGFKVDDVKFTKGERSLYASSEGVRRGFCGACGTTMTWEGDGEELGMLVEIHLGTLDDHGALTPKSHIHYRERVSWFDTKDSLPRYAVWEDESG